MLKHKLQYVALSALLLGSTGAFAELVRITSINGQESLTHADQISVVPGQVITLTADLIDDANTNEDDQAQDFYWSANDSSSDSCDVATGVDCFATSFFQVLNLNANTLSGTDQISFRVPETMGSTLTIKVKSHSSSTINFIGHHNKDTLTLVNSIPNYVPPTVVYTDPTQYTNSSFDPYIALAGMGSWVSIGGVQYFVPTTYTLDEDVVWQPIQHGYWAWTEDGWTWISYDSFGWATDHYGVWRRHGVYGWVWLPFPDRHYEPHTVTWFNSGTEYVGWYPYFDGYAEYGRHGENEGFVDGYWLGHDSMRGYGNDGYRYYPGICVVRGRDFNHGDMYEVVITRSYADHREMNNGEMRLVIADSNARGGFSRYPGGRSGPESRDFIAQRTPDHQVTETHVNQNGQFRQPVGVRPVPEQYKNVAASHDMKRPAPVGSTVDAHDHSAPPHVVPPANSGHGSNTPGPSQPNHQQPSAPPTPPTHVNPPTQGGGQNGGGQSHGGNNGPSEPSNPPTPPTHANPPTQGGGQNGGGQSHGGGTNNPPTHSAPPAPPAHNTPAPSHGGNGGNNNNGGKKPPQN